MPPLAHSREAGCPSSSIISVPADFGRLGPFEARGRGTEREQLGSVLAEPGALVAPVRAVPLDERPERREWFGTRRWQSSCTTT